MKFFTYARADISEGLSKLLGSAVTNFSFIEFDDLVLSDLDNSMLIVDPSLGEEEAKKLVEHLSQNENLHIVFLFENEPFKFSAHNLSWPIDKEALRALVDNLKRNEVEDYSVVLNEDSKGKAAVAKINAVIDEVFDQKSHEVEEVSMSENEDDKNGLEFNIPGDEDSLDLASDSDEGVENAPEQDSEEGALDLGDDSINGLSLSEEGEEAESFEVSNNSSGDLDLGEDSDEGLSLSAEDDDQDAFNTEESESNAGDLDLDNPPASESKTETIEASDDLDDLDDLDGQDGFDDLDLGEDEFSMSDDLGSDDDLGELDDDFDLDDDLNLDDTQSDDSMSLSEDENDSLIDKDLEKELDAQTESAELTPVQDASDSTGEINMAELTGEIDIDHSEFEDEFSDIDLTGKHSEEDLAQTKVHTSTDIGAAELDKTISSMLFGDDLKDKIADAPSNDGTTTDSIPLDHDDIGESDTSSLNFSNTKTNVDDQTAVSEPEVTAQINSPVKAEKAQDFATQTQLAAPGQVQSVPKEELISVQQYTEDELLRLQGTIRQLREEREELLSTIETLKSDTQLAKQDKTTVDAELDELKIEISILKKRHLTEVEELRYQVKLSDEKKEIYEQRAKNLQKEFDRLGSKVRIDLNKVQQREKELESQLELISMDSDSKVKSRDMKILELKRKIDALEFNMENVAIREQKLKDDKHKLEDRLNKIMKTLRGSIKILEDDSEYLGEETLENKDS